MGRPMPPNPMNPIFMRNPLVPARVVLASQLNSP